MTPLKENGNQKSNWIKQKAAKRDHFWDFEKYLRIEFGLEKKVLIHKIFKPGPFFVIPWWQMKCW